MSAKPLDSWILRLGFPENTSDLPEIAIARCVRGAEDFFVEANGLSGDQTSFRHQRGLRPQPDFPFRAFFLIEDLISQLNIHHYAGRIFAFCPESPEFFPQVVFCYAGKEETKVKQRFYAVILRLDPSRCLETWWRNSDSVGWKSLCFKRP